MSEPSNAARAGAREACVGEAPLIGSGVVLIVDDHVAVARSLVLLLHASGFDVRAVHSGADALAFVRDHDTALMLLDLSMPDMSGADVLRTLRAPGAGSTHALPVVMISADDDQATREELTRIGATNVVSKTDPGKLLRVVAAHVRPARPPRA